jgi:hypothetical protein
MSAGRTLGTLVVLDAPTELDISSGSEQIHAILYPGAGEAVIFARGSSGPARPPRAPKEDRVGRANRKMRRYALANRFTRLVTLTYESAERSEARSRRRLKLALRNCRRLLGGAFPYIFVHEEHPGGHGLHLHLLLPTEAAALLRKVWNHGHVDVRRVRSRAGLRQAASYLSKSFQEDASGRHRYEVGQGFAPEQVRLEASSNDTVWACLRTRMGSDPSVVKDYAHLGLRLRLAWWDDARWEAICSRGTPCAAL